MSRIVRTYYKLVHPDNSHMDVTLMYVNKQKNDIKRQILTEQDARDCIANDYKLLQEKQPCRPFTHNAERRQHYQAYWDKHASELQIVKVTEITETIAR